MTKRCGYIALAGRPNAGKSTFLNKVLGEKVSIVSDKPQTTRNKIMGVYHGPDLQVGFIDLPGIHKPKFKLNKQMMRAVTQGLEDADLIFHFVDVSTALGPGDRFVNQFLADRDIPVIMVANKMDLVNKSKVIPKLSALQDEFSPTELVPVSSLNGDNTERLLEVAKTFLPEGEFIFGEDDLTDQPVRFMVQEFIREKLLHYTYDELPHAVAVTIEEFTYIEEEDGYGIGAVIWVERPSQRKIILGGGGKMISKITSGARRSLKGLLGKPVDLELFVKVEDKWRDKDRFIGDLELPK